MMNDSKIILFSTDHCTLCDAALDMLLGMRELQGCSLCVIDVATDDELLHRYGERLPVVRVGEQELGWPFGREELLRILEQSG